MGNLFNGEGTRYRGCKPFQRMSSSAPSSAGVLAGCDISVHLIDANTADKNDGSVPYQTGSGDGILKKCHNLV